MSINQRLINVDFNSYRLGRFLSADHEHSANFAAAPLRAIRVDDAAAFGLPAGALVPLAAQAPALRRNRLVTTRAVEGAASSAGASASSSRFYCVDADGVRSIPSGQTVLAFDASHASAHSGIAMAAARDSQLLVHYAPYFNEEFARHCWYVHFHVVCIRRTTPVHV
jgi:hypothetical protein